MTPSRLPFTRCAHSLISLYMAWKSPAGSCKLESLEFVLPISVRGDIMLQKHRIANKAPTST